MPEVSVIIPTMNEESSIGAVIDEVQTALVGWPSEILIVDTDSRDRTRDIATAKGARVVPEPRRGYGRAYKTGFAAATGTFVSALDADLTYPAHRFPDFLTALAEDRADFVSGDRLSGLSDGAMTGMHRVGNEILNFAFRSCTIPGSATPSPACGRSGGRSCPVCGSSTTGWRSPKNSSSR